MNRRNIRLSKMKALEKFDAEFSKPMADKNPKILEALYFRGGNGGAIPRTNSVGLANSG
jgi:hypothetical protein